MADKISVREVVDVTTQLCRYVMKILVLVLQTWHATLSTATSSNTVMQISFLLGLFVWFYFVRPLLTQ